MAPRSDTFYIYPNHPDRLVNCIRFPYKPYFAQQERDRTNDWQKYRNFLYYGIENIWTDLGHGSKTAAFGVYFTFGLLRPFAFPTLPEISFSAQISKYQIILFNICLEPVLIHEQACRIRSYQKVAEELISRRQETGTILLREVFTDDDSDDERTFWDAYDGYYDTD
jgi:hypothetical protein